MRTRRVRHSQGVASDCSSLMRRASCLMFAPRIFTAGTGFEVTGDFHDDSWFPTTRAGFRAGLESLRPVRLLEEPDERERVERAAQVTPAIVGALRRQGGLDRVQTGKMSHRVNSVRRRWQNRGLLV